MTRPHTDAPREKHSEAWYRCRWLWARIRGMPLPYRQWRERVDWLFAIEARVAENRRSEKTWDHPKGGVL